MAQVDVTTFLSSMIFIFVTFFTFYMVCVLYFIIPVININKIRRLNISFLFGTARL